MEKEMDLHFSCFYFPHSVGTLLGVFLHSPFPFNETKAEFKAALMRPLLTLP